MQKRIRAALLVLSSAVALSLLACSTLSAEKDMPAVVTQPTAASRAELNAVIRDALNGAPVMLAEDALTKESVVLIERVPRRDADGRLLDGRSMEAPEKFELVMNNSSCILIHQRTGKRLPLSAVTCEPASQP